MTSRMVSTAWTAYRDAGVQNGAYWHFTLATNTCLATTDVPAAQNIVAYMGNNYCNYESAHPGEFLEYDHPIQIPAQFAGPVLEFQSYAASEGCNGWDFHVVEVSNDDGATWTEVAQACASMFTWTTVSVDLSAYQGQEIRFRFAFYVIDSYVNNYVGWVVDDVRIAATDCDSYNFCTAAPNSTGVGATMGHTGTKRVHLNNFVLTLDGGPPGQFAHFFYGTTEDQVPMAGGYLCVGTDANGFRRLYPGGQIDANGHLDWPIDFPTLQNQYTILPGTSWKFQCWYRDWVNGQSTSNFSDGLSVTFCP
ncbi:MAG: hypothetical protein R3E96_02145 [Planctomycetota bacterium]